MKLTLLLNEGGIVPSRGFAESVMEAVLREGAITPPILFPWKGAVPGFALCVIVIGASLIRDIAAGRTEPIPVGRAVTPALNGAGWIAAALLLSLATVVLAGRSCVFSRGQREINEI